MKKWESESQQSIAKIVNRKEVILYPLKKYGPIESKFDIYVLSS